jgi:clan AA aspartic protease
MFQKTGSINENLQAILKIELKNGAALDCLLDMGFQGTLVIPRKFAKRNLLMITGRETFLGAESSDIEFDTAIAEIKWLGDEFSLPVLVSDSTEALLGVEMLIDTILKIDYINSTVTITKPK